MEKERKRMMDKNVFDCVLWVIFERMDCLMHEWRAKAKKVMNQTNTQKSDSTCLNANTVKMNRRIAWLSCNVLNVLFKFEYIFFCGLFLLQFGWCFFWRPRILFCRAGCVEISSDSALRGSFKYWTGFFFDLRIFCFVKSYWVYHSFCFFFHCCRRRCCCCYCCSRCCCFSWWFCRVVVITLHRPLWLLPFLSFKRKKKKLNSKPKKRERRNGLSERFYYD